MVDRGAGGSEAVVPMRLTVTLIGILTAAVAGGCHGTSAAVQRVVPVASTDPYEQDIPLPVGFVLADHSSEDWSGGSIRYLRHRYVGVADKFAIRRFYREQMPLLRWKAVGDSHVRGRIVMRFERGRESNTVTIENDGRGRSGRLAIDVLITPLAR